MDKSLLMERVPILYFDDLPLYESELDDNGVSQLRVKASAAGGTASRWQWGSQMRALVELACLAVQPLEMQSAAQLLCSQLCNNLGR